MNWCQKHFPWSCAAQYKKIAPTGKLLSLCFQWLETNTAEKPQIVVRICFSSWFVNLSNSISWHNQKCEIQMQRASSKQERRNSYAMKLEMGEKAVGNYRPCALASSQFSSKNRRKSLELALALKWAGSASTWSNNLTISIIAILQCCKVIVNIVICNRWLESKSKNWCEHRVELNCEHSAELWI